MKRFMIIIILCFASVGIAIDSSSSMFTGSRRERDRPPTDNEEILKKWAAGPQTDDAKREYSFYYDSLLSQLEDLVERYEKSNITTVQNQPDSIIFSIATGFAALTVCSAIFVSGIDERTAIVEDGTIASPFVWYDIDYDTKYVNASMKIFSGQVYKAIFLGPTLGCVLVGGEGVTEEYIRGLDFGHQNPIPPRNMTEVWPWGDGPPEAWPHQVNQQCVLDVVNADFADELANTRSTVIIYDGKLIFERYAPTVNARTPLLSWSMAKSLTSALYGILHQQGLFDIQDRVAVPEWQGRFDRRQAITYNDMLHMTSGILWGEGLDLFACLYFSNDCAKLYAKRPRIAVPSLRFNYATGNTYMLARILEASLRQQRDINTFDWHREMLFRRMGMDNAVFEFVPTNDDIYLAGGSLAYLTARDWARFGLLYLRKGEWFGQHIINPDWVDFSCNPHPDQEAAWFYGAQWWFHDRQVDPLNCVAEGFRRQNVFVMPTRNVVVVRNAMPDLKWGWMWDRTDYINRLMACMAWTPWPKDDGTSNATTTDTDTTIH